MVLAFLPYFLFCHISRLDVSVSSPNVQSQGSCGPALCTCSHEWLLCQWTMLRRVMSESSSMGDHGWFVYRFGELFMSLVHDCQVLYVEVCWGIEYWVATSGATKTSSIAVVFGNDTIDSIHDLTYTTGRFAIFLYLPAVDQCLGAPVGFHWLHLLMPHDTQWDRNIRAPELMRCVKI